MPVCLPFPSVKLGKAEESKEERGYLNKRKTAHGIKVDVAHTRYTRQIHC